MRNKEQRPHLVLEYDRILRSGGKYAVKQKRNGWNTDMNKTYCKYPVLSRFPSFGTPLRSNLPLFVLVIVILSHLAVVKGNLVLTIGDDMIKEEARAKIRENSREVKKQECKEAKKQGPVWPPGIHLTSIQVA